MQRDTEAEPAGVQTTEQEKGQAEGGEGIASTLEMTEAHSTASGVGKLLAEMMERLLVCEICQEDFRSPQRLPRVLPCHHAFCGECLQQLCKDAHLNCPKCRRCIPVKDEFPVETTRMTLLDLKKIMGSQEGQDCEGCSRKVKATARCLECEESLCEDCWQAHKVVKATRDHSLVSLTEAASDPSKLLQLTEKCGKHGGKVLEFYCTDCQQPSCSSCAILSHSGHKMVELEAIVDSKRNELRAECQRLKDAVKTFQARVDSCTNRLKIIDARRQETLSKIRELFTDARKILKDKEEQCVSDLEDMVREDELALKDEQTRDQSLLSEAQVSLESGERLALLGLPSQLLSGPQDMARTYDDLERLSTKPAPVPLYQVASGINALTEAVEKMGKIKRKAVEDGETGQASSGNTEETARPNPASEKGQGESIPATSRSPPRSATKGVELLLLPRSRGSFQAHLDSVGRDLRRVLEKNYDVRVQSWAPCRKNGDPPVLIVFQGQGRSGDEFPGAIPQELRGSSQRVMVVVIQDDEITTAMKDIVPADVNLIGVVNVHVIPMQHQLHTDGFSFCPKNQQEIGTIARLLNFEPFGRHFQNNGGITRGQENVSRTSVTSPQAPKELQRKGQDAPNVSRAPQAKKMKETAGIHAELLPLPRSSGAFQKHLDSIAASVVNAVQRDRHDRIFNWTPGRTRGDSVVLIVFQSQGSPGVEFPGAVPPELKGSSQRVVVVVIQDDEYNSASKDIVPADVNCIGVINVHVIPMQQELHVHGSSLCSRNQQAVKMIAQLLSS